jgi:hypothetical protein
MPFFNTQFIWTLNVNSIAFSPADTTVLYFGNNQRSPSAISGVNKIYIRRACTITAAELNMQVNGAVGTNENITLAVSKNGSTFTGIATVGSAAVERIFSNTGLSIPLASGDWIEIRLTPPAWATNPTNIFIGGYITFTNT